MNLMIRILFITVLIVLLSQFGLVLCFDPIDLARFFVEFLFQEVGFNVQEERGRIAVSARQRKVKYTPVSKYSRQVP